MNKAHTDSPSQKMYYNGLYGNNTIEFVEGLIHIHPFGVIGKKNNGVVPLHAHKNILQIFILEAGETELQCDDNAYTIGAPAFITVPKNVAHGFQHGKNVGGWIINLSNSMLEQLLKREADIVVELNAIHVSTIKPEEQAMMQVFKTMKQCILEYQNNFPGKQLMLESLVSQIIVQLYRLPSQTTKLISSSDSVGSIYFKRFLQMIKNEHTFKKSVREYADDLNISKANLNRICKLSSGKSPKRLITDYFIREAQNSLTQMDRSIAEVSQELGITDAAYFARLFKKKTGLTPKDFRLKHEEMNHRAVQ